MTMSLQAERQAQELLRLALLLISLLESLISKLNSSDVSGLADALTVVRRYTDLISNSITLCDVDNSLRAANLFTTINKGLNDIAVAARYPAITEQGFTIMQHATELASLLRAERGGLLKT